VTVSTSAALATVSVALKGLLPEAGFNAISQLLGLTSSMRTWHGHTSQEGPLAGSPGQMGKVL
jgi:hypothetical protein